MTFWETCLQLVEENKHSPRERVTLFIRRSGWDSSVCVTLDLDDLSLNSLAVENPDGSAIIYGFRSRLFSGEHAEINSLCFATWTPSAEDLGANDWRVQKYAEGEDDFRKILNPE